MRVTEFAFNALTDGLEIRSGSLKYGCVLSSDGNLYIIRVGEQLTMHVAIRKRIVLLLGIIGICGMGGLALGQVSSKVREYNADQVEIEEFELLENGKVKITFNVMPETVWYCPGVYAKESRDELQLTFVRAWIKERPKVDFPTEKEKDGFTRYIIVEPDDNPIYLRFGKEKQQIYPEPKE